MMSKATHDSFYPYRETDEIEQEKLDAGYEFLGWQVHSGNNDKLKACLELGHNDGRTEPHYKSKQHNPRGSNVTYWCDACKLLWKIDMSD